MAGELELFLFILVVAVGAVGLLWFFTRPRSDMESPVIPHHDTSRRTYPSILYLENYLALGQLAGACGFFIFLVTSNDYSLWGEYREAALYLSGGVGFLAPVFAIGAKLPVDLWASRGPWMDIGDGIMRNVKSLDEVRKAQPIRVSYSRPLEPEELVVFPAEAAREAGLIREDELPDEDALERGVMVHGDYLPVWYGGHDYAAMGTDGCCFMLLGAYAERNHVVLRGLPWDGELPGFLSINGQVWHAGYRPWDVEWEWVKPILGRDGQVIVPGRWDAPALPDNLVEYLETSAYGKAAGATVGHRTKTDAWGRVPKLYHKGFVKIAYVQVPPNPKARAAKRFLALAEAEKTDLWGLQGLVTTLRRQIIRDNEALAQTGVAASISAQAVQGGGGMGGGAYPQAPERPRY